VQVNEFSLASYHVAYSDNQGGYSPENTHWSKDAQISRVFESIVEESILSQKSLDHQLKK